MYEYKIKGAIRMAQISIRFILKKYNGIPIHIRASLWFLICSFLEKGISMLVTPIFTRILTTSEFGQYNVFNSWMGVLTILVNMSLSGGVYTQGLIKFESDKRVFSSSLQGLACTLTTLWTIIYLIYYDFWNDLFGLTTVQMLAMLVMIWTSTVFGFWSNEQRADYKYKSLVLITLLASLGKPLIGITFVLFADDKVTARILSILLVELVCYSGLFIVQMRRGKKFYSTQYWKYSLLFNIPLVPHYLSQIVLSSADRIMISNMVGDSEAGIYSLAYSLSSIMVLFNTAIMQTLNPWIYRKIKANDAFNIAPVAYTSLIIIATVNLILILIAPETVAIFAPQTYHEAIYVIPPVAMSVYFMYSYDLFAKFAFYYEKTKLIMIASVIGAILNIVLNYIFIRIFGYMAAGYTTLFCYITYGFAHYILMNNICKVYCGGIRPYNGKTILCISIPFMIIGFAFLATYDHPYIRYGIIIIFLTFALINHKLILVEVKDLMTLKRKL